MSLSWTSSSSKRRLAEAAQAEVPSLSDCSPPAVAGLEEGVAVAMLLAVESIDMGPDSLVVVFADIRRYVE